MAQKLTRYLTANYIRELLMVTDGTPITNMMRDYAKSILDIKRYTKPQPNFLMWYCKDNKERGDTIIIKNVKTGNTRSQKSFKMNNVNIEMSNNNATSNAKRSGATTILRIFKND